MEWLTGQVGYRGGDGALTGQERFDMVSHAGGYGLSALCRLFDADLVREVSLAMDRHWRPLDGFCRLVRGGRICSSQWFDVGEDGVRVAARVDGRALPDRHIPLDRPLRYLGLHPLQGDALMAAVRGTEEPGLFRRIPAVTNSVSPNGDEDIGAQLIGIDAAYIGPAKVEVPAGLFDASQYRLRWRDDWPPANLWVARDFPLFLRMDWALTPMVYELLEVTGWRG